MARKKKHPEHVNLERYLVSYADFITLLFATFVVLYALSQVDIADFNKLEESLQNAFAAPTLIEGSQSLLDNKGDNLLGKNSADSVIESMMLEYLSPKYEEQSYEAIKRDIEKMLKQKELEGVSVSIDARGLVIKLDDSDILFESASAKLTPGARKKLDKVGLLIAQKFLMHSIRVEGNTDSLPFSSGIYPSNWELSASRACSIVRYLIARFRFHEELFTPVGFSSTRPIADNSTLRGRALNRRVEIVVLRNKNNKLESNPNSVLKMTKKKQEEYRQEHLKAINQVKGITDKSVNIPNEAYDKAKQAVILNDIYRSESKRIFLEKGNFVPKISTDKEK